MDITADDETGQPYDFSIRAQRTKAETLPNEQQPMLLIGSPMCPAFSAIQAIYNIPEKRKPLIIAREKAAGRLHLDWCCYLYRNRSLEVLISCTNIRTGRFPGWSPAYSASPAYRESSVTAGCD